jgi:hypothetical protein
MVVFSNVPNLKEGIKTVAHTVLTFNVESGIAHIFGGLNLCGITFLI